MVLGGACGVFLAVQPTHVEETRSIGIDAPAAIVYGEVNGLLHHLKWDGVAGKDPQWIESRVENQSVKCGLTEQGFDEARVLAFELTPEGAGVRLTSRYEGDARTVNDRLVYAFTKNTIARSQQQFLDTIKHVAERRRGVE